ncbi:MAG: ABC transporter ATP-binding protein, partial [Aquamicrobium sp.]|nr:ABC transporter ATP-binding protein [Aquamicrobium sp.]
AGTVLLVSHDRDFLDRTVTSTVAPDGGGRWVEYAGGYSDMLAQRGGARLDERGARGRKDEPERKAKAEPKPAAAGPAKKLSYKQKYALETLPKQMEEAHGKIAALEVKMTDPAFYARDPQGFAKVAAELDALREKLAAMEEEWLELEMLREEIEG